MKNKQDGFTVPEVLTVLVLTGLITGLIFTFTFGYWRYGYLLEADLDTYVTRLNAGDYLRENLSASSGMIIQNSIIDTNTEKPDPAITSNLYWEPIHAIPSTITANSNEIKPIFYFRRPSIDTSKNIVMNGTQPYEDEYVLYLDGRTRNIYSRILANTNATNNRNKTSCPTNEATSACPSDRLIASDVVSVQTKYFSRTANLIDYTSAVDPLSGEYVGPDFPAVEVVELTINIEKKPLLQLINSTKNNTVIRVALRNT